MQVKKRTMAGFAFFLLLMLMTMCAGCGNKEAKEVNITELANRLQSGIQYADELSETSTDMFWNLFSMDKNLVEEQKTFNNSGASAEIISVVRCKDKTGAQAVKEAFETFVSERSAMYKSYNPTEAAKLDKAVVVIVEERYVVLCVSPDSAKAKEIIGK